MKTASWREIEEFCRKDGWEFIRSSDHAFYRKVLVDGTILDTHVSFAEDKTMSPGRFSAILRNLLKVSEVQFWEVLRNGRPVQRQEAQLTLPTRPLPTWIARVLVDEIGLSSAQIADLSEDEAKRIVEEHRSRQRRQE